MHSRAPAHSRRRVAVAAAARRPLVRRARDGAGRRGPRAQRTGQRTLRNARRRARPEIVLPVDFVPAVVH